MTYVLGAPNIVSMDTNLVIARLGGTAAVAEMCGVKPPSVSEWRKNGIPHARIMYLRLLRPEVFEEEQSTHSEQSAA